MKQEVKRILPKGYYISKESNPYIVTLEMGPFKGLQIQLCEDVKIRKDYLTDVPQLLYNYRILYYAGYDENLVETSKELSRILGAIMVELLYDEYSGGLIKQMDNDDRKQNRNNNT